MHSVNQRELGHEIVHLTSKTLDLFMCLFKKSICCCWFVLYLIYTIILKLIPSNSPVSDHL